MYAVYRRPFLINNRVDPDDRAGYDDYTVMEISGDLSPDAGALHVSDDGSEDRGSGGWIGGHTVVTMARCGSCARGTSSRQSGCKCEKKKSSYWWTEWDSNPYCVFL